MITNTTQISDTKQDGVESTPAPTAWRNCRKILEKMKYDE